MMTLFGLGRRAWLLLFKIWFLSYFPILLHVFHEKFSFLFGEGGRSHLELQSPGIDVEATQSSGHLWWYNLVKALGVVDKGVRLVITLTQVLVVVLVRSVLWRTFPLMFSYMTTGTIPVHRSIKFDHCMQWKQQTSFFILEKKLGFSTHYSKATLIRIFFLNILKDHRHLTDWL